MENAFVNEYPKLLRLFNDLFKRLRTHMEIKDPKDETRQGYEQQLIASLSKFEHKYLSRSLTILFEPINQIFAPGRSAPTSEDVVCIISASGVPVKVSNAVLKSGGPIQSDCN